MAKQRSIAMFVILSALLLSMACSSNEPPSQLSSSEEKTMQKAMEQKQPDATAARQESRPASEPAQAAQSKPLIDVPKTIEITGMVEKGSDGIVIVTNQGNYNVIGQDLSALVGKTVNVTGALEESAGQYTIKVLSFSESQ